MLRVGTVTNRRFSPDLVRVIENQLKNSSNFVPEISLFEEESESKSFSHYKSPLNTAYHRLTNPFTGNSTRTKSGLNLESSNSRERAWEGFKRDSFKSRKN